MQRTLSYCLLVVSMFVAAFAAFASFSEVTSVILKVASAVIIDVPFGFEAVDSLGQAAIMVFVKCLAETTSVSVALVVAAAPLIEPGTT